MTDDNQQEIQNLTFEAALQELQNIAAQLEKGDSPLQQAISLYERGEKLQKHCEKLLKEAELKFEQVGSASDDK